MKQKTKILHASDFDVHVTYKQIKNMYIRVNEQGQVEVSAPFGTSDIIILDFADKFKEKMKKGIDKANSLNAKNTSRPTYMLFFGMKYDIVEINSNENTITFKDDKVYVCSENPLSDESLRLSLKELQRNMYKDKLIKIFAECEKIVGKQAQEWHIKDMKTKWGTCNVQDRRVWIRLLLCEYPECCTRMTVIHELCHLYERGHSSRFYAYMDKFCPEHRQIDNLMRLSPEDAVKAYDDMKNKPASL